jgi:hypothetical protein
VLREETSTASIQWSKANICASSFSDKPLPTCPKRAAMRLTKTINFRKNKFNYLTTSLKFKINLYIYIALLYINNFTSVIYPITIPKTGCRTQLHRATPTVFLWPLTEEPTAQTTNKNLSAPLSRCNANNSLFCLNMTVQIFSVFRLERQRRGLIGRIKPLPTPLRASTMDSLKFH